MALLWSCCEKDILYQVRSAGSSIRLYTDGVLHSQFNPKQVLTGSIWDLLWLPLFFSPEPQVERILVLGTGAGAVIRQLHILFEPKQIVAIDNNPIHIKIAREYFGVEKEMASLHLADATEFLPRYRGTRFDLIIDDLFVSGGNIARRAVPCGEAWLKQLVRQLRTDGILCINFADREEFQLAPFFSLVGQDHRFANAFELSCPKIENIVLALVSTATDAASLRAHLQGTPVLSGMLARGALTYRVRPI
ncbi:MAG: SAM-dependent methyltransferase [Acidiferrobacteraceae bacterium]|nr:SAM-dependent methyltransferase [Acidiferrobacteraceae bacterium]